jgi:hypothetical protein
MAKSCAMCVHKFVCSYHANIMAAVEDSTRFIVGGKPQKMSLANVEIRRVIADICEYHKSIMDDENGKKERIDAEKPGEKRT